ncbi:MAG: YciI family protein [Actinomycetota bacterium]|nr:YciI family protein [Actinomycetota bacterium]
MRYALLIYSDQEPWFEMSEEEAAKATEDSLPKWYAFFEDLAQADPNMQGKELDDIRTAKTVRVRDGEVLITDGPFAETKEQIGGFFDTNLPDLDTAIAFAAKIPAATYGSIEVRPVVERD